MRGNDELVDLVFKLQNLWMGMNGRCNYLKHRSYKDYGAKGISLCPEWSGRPGSKTFVKWALANGYKRGLDLDRRDNDGGYSPDNCRFVSHQENCWNKSNNVMIEYEGETKCSAEWGGDPRCVVHTNQFQQRISAGWNIHRALTQPLRKTHANK